MAREFLVVDDSQVIRMTLQRMLQREGGVDPEDIRAAEDGEEAMELFYESPPDIVFMDIDMPGMDGEQAATAMLEEKPEIRIVVVTAMNRGDKRVTNLISMGAFEVVEKPIHSEDIADIFALLEREESGAGRIR